MILKEIEIRGKKYRVGVSGYGTFECQIDPQTCLREKTLEVLEEKLKQATRKMARVAVDVWRFDEKLGLLHGVATGIHAANRNLLINWDGKKGGEQHYRSSNNFMSLTVEEAEQGKAIYQSLLQAQQVVDEFLDAHRFDLEEAIQEALNGAKVEDDAD